MQFSKAARSVLGLLDVEIEPSEAAFFRYVQRLLLTWATHVWSVIDCKGCDRMAVLYCCFGLPEHGNWMVGEKRDGG